MRTYFSLAVLALVLALHAPRECFALWDVFQVTPEEAADLGIEVRVTPAGPDAVNLEFDFGIEDEFKDFERVELRVGQQNDYVVFAPLREERTEAGHVVVGFTAYRHQLDTLSVWIMVPGGAGGVAYDLQPSRFVE